MLLDARDVTPETRPTEADAARARRMLERDERAAITRNCRQNARQRGLDRQAREVSLGRRLVIGWTLFNAVWTLWSMTFRETWDAQRARQHQAEMREIARLRR